MKTETPDIIDRFGKPSKNAPAPLRRKEWRCDACGVLVRAPEPIKAPSPCKRCGNIGVIAVKDG